MRRKRKEKPTDDAHLSTIPAQFLQQDAVWPRSGKWNLVTITLNNSKPIKQLREGERNEREKTT
jgi:hypothetical protein